MKRTFDVILSIMLLLLTLPLIAAAVLLTWATSGSPVIFRQQRAGLHGRIFTILKLRTMQDGKVTALGRWLRRTAIDELPQLWNVLRGDMSIVGPRPLLAEYLPRYNATEVRRHEVRPGVTGWAQVHGRNDLPWSDRFALDVWYVDHQSLWLDLKILLLTTVRLLQRSGSSDVIPEFRGHA